MRLSPMTQYFLHIHNSHGNAEDDEGLVADSLAEARERAVAGIRSLLASEAANGEIDLKGRIEISDAAGKVLLSVPFADALTVKGLSGS